MPPWHAAPPRNTGAAAGLGAAVTGRGVAARLTGTGKGCCAVATDESASSTARAAIAIRSSDKAMGINITGSRANFTPYPHIVKSAQKEIRHPANVADTC
jgi:hypothetical protein